MLGPIALLAVQTGQKGDSVKRTGQVHGMQPRVLVILLCFCPAAFPMFAQVVEAK